MEPSSSPSENFLFDSGTHLSKSKHARQHSTHDTRAVAEAEGSLPQGSALARGFLGREGGSSRRHGLTPEHGTRVHAPAPTPSAALVCSREHPHLPLYLCTHASTHTFRHTRVHTRAPTPSAAHVCTRQPPQLPLYLCARTSTHTFRCTCVHVSTHTFCHTRVQAQHPHLPPHSCARAIAHTVRCSLQALSHPSRLCPQSPVFASGPLVPTLPGTALGAEGADSSQGPEFLPPPFSAANVLHTRRDREQ